MIKKICLMVMVVMNCVVVFGQAWEWAKSAGGNNYDCGNSIAADVNGNSYVTGYFKSNAITFGSFTLTNSGNKDIFTVKYDPLGNVMWAKRAGGFSEDVSHSIAVDAAGNAYITGNFYSSSISFGSITLYNTTSNTNPDLFIAKYDALGNLIWAKKAGGNHNDIGYGIAVDLNSNIFLTGLFGSNTISFDTITLTSSGSGYSFFVAKYDSSGNAFWAKTVTGSGNMGRSVTVDLNGNCYITGKFQSSTINFGNTTLTNSGQDDIFIVKYNSVGNVIWAKQGGGSSFDYGTGITADAFGEVYITGYFNSTSIAFDSLNVVGNGLNTFVVKYDAIGNAIWAKNSGAYGNAWGIASDIYGNSYSTGMNGGNIFIFKYDSSGILTWSTNIVGNPYGGNGYGIALDATGNIFLTGDFYDDSLMFDNISILLAGANYSDAYIAKYGINEIGLFEQSNLTNPITLYPNPTTSQLTITSPYPIDKIEITNVIGQLIYSATPKEKSVEVALKQQGIYFVTAITNNQTFTKKVVVER